MNSRSFNSSNTLKLVGVMLLTLIYSLPVFGQGGELPSSSEVMSSKNEVDVLGLPQDGAPLVLRASFYLQDINRIDDEAETFQITGVLKLGWRDSRLSFAPDETGVKEKIYQGNFQFDEVSPSWYPQVVLVNEAGSIEKQAVILRVLPDGTCNLIQTINANVKVSLNMRRYPFDSHSLEAKFRVLGFDAGEVLFEVDPQAAQPLAQAPTTAQWRFVNFGLATREEVAPYSGESGVASTFVVSVDMQRESFFVVRLVVLPLAIIVVLSTCVFWMERASLGDRINVSFIGILTAVAYQLVIGDLLPHISYMTLLNGFVNISLITMGAGVVINLVVGSCDRQGKIALGERIDRLSRWILPAVYFGTLAVITFIAFVFF